MRLRTVVGTILVCGLAGVLAAQTSGQTGDSALQQQVAAIASAHQGKVAMFAEQLNTGKTVALDADTPVQTASVIKLAILYDAMVEVREGKANWDEKMVLKPGEAVSGSGMLLFFDTPLTLTLKDVLTMMVVVSDNTAANMAMDRFGIDAVNARMESLGLRNTHLYKKVMKPATEPMPADQPKFGLGKTTPREMAELMTDIGECRLHETNAAQVAKGAAAAFAPMDDQDKAVCAVTLGMLKDQFYRDTVPRYLPNGGDQTVASKTGSLNAVRNDVAIVAGKTGPMVLSIFTYDNADHSWTVDNGAEVTIAKIAKAIVDAWSPEGLDAKALVPGLGMAK
ncbi:MAG TPA: serine hydrolase [Acidobacteriaceae bacterium]|jgi:beta-lactamase class A|nr:serine hydrolase [Acidobacteriaceae bacterium]